MTTPRWLLKILWLEDRALSRLTGGRMTMPNGTGGRVRTLFLHTVGRSTGQPRRNGLYYLEDGANLVVVASNAGRDEDPAWWLNLRAQPDTEVEVGTDVREVHARRASAEEAAALYERFAAALPQYAGYRRRTTREIPVVILEPR
ncbi:MAG TPA: nitroreductase/quinone reductase family protein [Candidatus Limnocylindria bacterium]